MTEVQIGGESRRIGELSAFKAFKAMELIGEAEGTWRDALSAAAEFKAGYEAENVVTIERPEARRQFRPRTLVRTLPVEKDGELVVTDDGPVFREEPVLGENGEPLLTADPLGHVSEQDWSSADHKLRVPDSPPRSLQQAVMWQYAFKHGRESILKLLALVLASNADVEKWAEDEQLDERLTTEGKRLVHRALAGELVLLGKATVEAVRDQLRDPFEEVTTAIRSLKTEPKAATPTAGPMRIEQEEEEGDEASPPEAGGSTSSPEPTAADPTPASSTESPSSSPTSSAPA